MKHRFLYIMALLLTVATGAVAQYTYKVSLKEGTVDATIWQGKAGTGNYQALPLEGVALGTAVSVKYSGWKLLVKSVKAKKKKKPEAASLIVNPAVGQVIGNDGKNYDYASLPGGVTAVAKICYVSGSKCLALALADVGKMVWEAAVTTAAAHTPAITGGTWRLATKDEWTNMITAAGSWTALCNGFSSVGGVNMEDGNYWSGTEFPPTCAWALWGNWSHPTKDSTAPRVRPCLVFWLQDPDPIELTPSADGTVWTLSTMPEYDVELEVTYYTEGVELTKNPDGTWTLAPTPVFDLELEVEYETALALSEATDNSAALTEWNGYEADVTLTRTLYKDGDWNTLTLPFALSAEQIAASPLAGCTLMKLDKDGIYDTKQTGYDASTGTLYLYFTGATAIEAGVPYIVKWTSGENIVSPVFEGVTINKELNNIISDDGKVEFIGNYSPVVLPGSDKENLYLGANNKLYTPSADRTMNAFRTYFHVDLGTSQIKRYALNFGGETVTGIFEVEDESNQMEEVRSKMAEGWFDLSGRSLSGKPTQKGVYIQNGNKVIIP